MPIEKPRDAHRLPSHHKPYAEIAAGLIQFSHPINPHGKQFRPDKRPAAVFVVQPRISLLLKATLRNRKAFQQAEELFEKARARTTQLSGFYRP
jgi:hypothetical protein